MKFGLWNRLALVLGVAGALAFPTWWALSTNAHHATVTHTVVSRCDREVDPAGQARTIVT